MAPIRTRRKANRFFDVAAPHKKARRPFAYRIPFLAKLHLYGPHRKKKQAAVLGGSIAFLVLLVLIFQVEVLFANLRTLHPSTCSGDWQDAASLTGEPGLGEAGALATQAGQKIFCSFAIPKLKEPVPLTRAVLALSFKNEQPSPIIEESGTHEENASTTEPVVEEVPVEEVSASETASEPFEEEAPASEPVVEETPVEEPVPEPEVEEVPAEEVPQEEPVSFWQKLFATSAHAQEEVPTEESTSEPVVEEPVIKEAPLSEEEPIVEEVPVGESAPEPQEEVSIEELVIEEAPSGRAPEEPETKLTISYTLDGVLWTDITTFAPKDNEVTFDLEIVSSDQVEKLVVRVTADEVAGEPVYLQAAELRIWTEAPLDDLLAPLLEEPTPGVRIYDKEFTIDPEATHSCLPVPLTIDLSATTTTTHLVTFSLGEDIGEGLRGIVADVSESILEVITGNQEATSTPEVVVEVATIAVESEVETASTSPEESPNVDENATSTEPVTEEPTGPIEALFESGVETLEAVARIRIGIVEIGSLPKNIDVRFASTTDPYVVELFEDSELSALLQATVVAPETAQQGSFSVPIIFTRTDGGESTVVCQVNIINKPEEVGEAP